MDEVKSYWDFRRGDIDRSAELGQRIVEDLLMIAPRVLL
jgi:hypothetical protein